MNHGAVTPRPATHGDPSPQGPADRPRTVSSATTLPLSSIDLENTQFMFRLALRLGDLKRSIEEAGQQLPIVVRPLEDGRFQIIAGFRRANALRALGASSVLAVVRNDLADDQAAFHFSIIENSARKTYSDVERAFAIRRLERAGHSSTRVAELMGLTPRQKNNIKALLQLPEDVQRAVDDPEHRITARHALLLRQAERKLGDLDYGAWLSRIDGDPLSVRKLNTTLRKELGHRDRVFATLFDEHGTTWSAGQVRLSPVRLDVQSLSAEERARLLDELERLTVLVREAGVA